MNGTRFNPRDIAQIEIITGYSRSAIVNCLRGRTARTSTRVAVINAAERLHLAQVVEHLIPSGQTGTMLSPATSAAHTAVHSHEATGLCPSTLLVDQRRCAAIAALTPAQRKTLRTAQDPRVQRKGVRPTSAPDAPIFTPEMHEVPHE